ncbi:NYN domain-containing protein [Neobittarella massiliensis]|uniref:NYN domain-containing protein n=2 Tax=Oscillospiraceae TaxID=216572 RepID=A0A8J6ILW5_9FIRM|nr:NYN domain-containing protein [Neobittarella massiliensis]MBC3516089.1 NYN domain-containing protein [Neobittarella massiliensis]SCJ37194.1 NYN domain [uncultured Anaerotruncus sp.]
MELENRFAVLIDADNVSGKYIKYILDEISTDGVATYKRIYGDWTSPSLGNWKTVLLDNSIVPIQQYSYTTGKNATDSAMIIDAMDILYSGNVDGFCIVSSDSDFTRLATRLRESGMMVVGMGEKKTPQPFISACNKFRYLEILAKSDAATDTVAAKTGGKTHAATVAKEMTKLTTIKKAIRLIIEEISDEDGWASAGDIGNLLSKRYPDFDVRNFGHKKLTPFLKSLNILELNPIRNSDGSSRVVYVRVK